VALWIFADSRFPSEDLHGGHGRSIDEKDVKKV
jgi:hypothetical protein